MLGRVLTRTARAAGFTVISHGNSCVAGEEAQLIADLSQRDAVIGLLTTQQPDILVNLIALTNVDECESDLNKAFCLNADIPFWLAQHASPATRVIQISTDHIYDLPGAQAAAESETILQNIYALTKRAGELPVLASGGVVLRTNFFGPSLDPRRQSLSDSIRTTLQRGNTFFGFNDVFFSPLTMSRLSEEILRVAQNWSPGLYNLGSKSGISKFEFARQVAKLYGFDPALIEERAMADAALTAVRPHGMCMNVSHFEATFDVTLPTLEAEIQSLET